MNKILELREKRAKAWEDAKKFLDEKRKPDGTISAEDEAVYDKMEAEVVALGREIDRMERQEAIDRELAAATSTPIVTKPEKTDDTRTGRASDEYKKAFWQQIRNQNSYEIRNALQEGADTEGGYLVPDEFEHTLVEALTEGNIIRSLAHVFTTSSGTHKIPVVASKGTASWVDEEGAIPESDDVFGQQNIGAHKVATLIKVSEELLNDSAFNLEQYFTAEYTRRIGSKEEEAFLSGDGVGKPTGILNTAEVGVNASTVGGITADELIDLFYSLNSSYRQNAVWILNDATMKIVRKLKDSNGQYLWQPTLHEGGYDTILGKKLYTSPYMPEAANGAKTVIFGDLSFYWIGDRQGINFKRLNERYADTGQIGFLASKRVDAKLILPEAVKVLQQKRTTSGS